MEILGPAAPGAVASAVPGAPGAAAGAVPDGVPDGVPDAAAGAAVDAAPDAVGLVLAAGQGSRLGLGAKALLRTGGVTLVERAVGVLRTGGCGRVLVVVGAQAEEVAPVAAGAGAEVVANPEWASGLASSFRAGVTALPAGAEAVVVLLVDQPGVGADLVARLLARHQVGRITVAQYGDGGASGGGPGDGDRGAQGSARSGGARHPMVFDTGLARAAAELADGDRGARAFLRANPELLDLVDCTDLGSAADVDTAEDLHLLEP